MWIQLAAAFVCSDKSSYVQSLSPSDFNQFSGEVCVCVCRRYRSGLCRTSVKNVRVRFLDACAHTTTVRMSEPLSDRNCLNENACKSFQLKIAPHKFLKSWSYFWLSLQLDIVELENTDAKFAADIYIR